VATGTTNANKASERRRIASIRVHPDYQQRVFYEQNEDGTPKAIRCPNELFRMRCRKVIGVREVRDVAVLELVDALPSRYQPITLGTAVDGPAVAYGYGRTDNNKLDGVLRRTKDNAYQVERCPERDDVLCARTSDSYVDSGDSGGPWLQERNGVSVQVGISSTGTPQSHLPVNIGAVAPWINRVAGLGGGGSNKVLIFGNGDFSDVDPLTNLGTILGAAGYQVTTSSELPADLNGYGAIWHIATAPLDAASADRLVTFAQSGRACT